MFNGGLFDLDSLVPIMNIKLSINHMYKTLKSFDNYQKGNAIKYFKALTMIMFLWQLPYSRCLPNDARRFFSKLLLKR